MNAGYSTAMDTQLTPTSIGMVTFLTEPCAAVLVAATIAIAAGNTGVGCCGTCCAAGSTLAAAAAAGGGGGGWYPVAYGDEYAVCWLLLC